MLTQEHTGSKMNMPFSNNIDFFELLDKSTTIQMPKIRFSDEKKVVIEEDFTIHTEAEIKAIKKRQEELETAKTYLSTIITMGNIQATKMSKSYISHRRLELIYAKKLLKILL